MKVEADGLPIDVAGLFQPMSACAGALSRAGFAILAPEERLPDAGSASGLARRHRRIAARRR